jgi:hypothetical protein
MSIHCPSNIIDTIKDPLQVVDVLFLLLLRELTSLRVLIVINVVILSMTAILAKTHLKPILLNLHLLNLILGRRLCTLHPPLHNLLFADTMVHQAIKVHEV